MIATYKLPLWPPSTNSLYIRVRGKTILTKPARQFYKDGRHFIRTPPVPLQGPFHVELDFYPPHRGTFDVDNRVKAVFDLLTKAGAWVDDRHVISFTARKHQHISTPLVVIKLFRNIGDNDHGGKTQTTENKDQTRIKHSKAKDDSSAAPPSKIGSIGTTRTDKPPATGSTDKEKPAPPASPAKAQQGQGRQRGAME